MSHFKPNLKSELDGIQANQTPEQRDASFDFCYGYFQTHRHQLTDNMQLSCLHLWSYLGSWGMLRGNGKLVTECSMKVFADVITYIETLNDSDWSLDLPDYADAAKRNRIIEIYNRLTDIIAKIKVGGYEIGIGATPTLVTKIMLGTLGCVPALDDNFTTVFRAEFDADKPHCGFRRLTNQTLVYCYDFYKDNQAVFDSLKYPVIDFDGNPVKDLYYPKAKLLDMYGFNTGIEIELQKIRNEMRLKLGLNIE